MVSAAAREGEEEGWKKGRKGGRRKIARQWAAKGCRRYLCEPS